MKSYELQLLQVSKIASKLRTEHKNYTLVTILFHLRNNGKLLIMFKVAQLKK